MNSDGVDRTVVGWRVWYAGGAQYMSTTCSWEELPEVGLLAVVLYYRTRPRCRIMTGRSLYWVEDTPEGRIYAFDDRADAILPEGAAEKRWVKRGKWVTDEEMAEVSLAVQAFQTFAPDESVRVDRGS